MIIADEQGTRMHMNCLSRFFQSFEHFFEQGACLRISSPDLGTNYNTFKYVESPYKICMNHNTNISRCNEVFGSPYALNFTTFESIERKTAPEHVTIDVIGYVVRIFEKAICELKNGNQSHRRTIQIQDLDGNKLFITLWDNYETRFSQYVEHVQDGSPVVIVLQFGRIRRFGDNAYVNTTFDITRLFVNDDIEEINSFKLRLLEKPLKSETSGSSRTSSSRTSSSRTSSSRTSSSRTSSSLFYSLADDFLVDNAFVNVAEVTEIQKPQSVVILASIVYIEQHMPWYYDACSRCSRKVYKKDVKSEILGTSTEADESVENNKMDYECTTKDCLGKPLTVIPRIKVVIRIQDASGTISVTLFDREATRILKKSTKELVDKYVEGSYERLLPDEFYELMDRKYAFKLDITNFNLNNKHYVYGISKLSDDPNIIGQLQNRIEEQVEQAHENFEKSSLNVFPADPLNRDTDPISSSAENNTPVSQTANFKGKGKISNAEEPDDAGNYRTPELKRTLNDVYDVDDDTVLSTTKVRPGASSVIYDVDVDVDVDASISTIKEKPTAAAGDKNDGKLKLGIPKIEK